MVRVCCLKSCRSSSKKEKLRFFRIPGILKNQGEATHKLSVERRNLWLKKLSLGAALLTEHTRICSKHFFSGAPATLFDQSNPDWIPSPTIATTVEKAFKRYERRKNRSVLKPVTNVMSVPNLPIPNSANPLNGTVELESINPVTENVSDASDSKFQDVIFDEAENDPVIENFSQPLKELCEISMVNSSIHKYTQTLQDLNVNVTDSGTQSKEESIDSSTQAVVDSTNSSTQTLFRTIETFELEFVELNLEKANKDNSELAANLKEANEQLNKKELELQCLRSKLKILEMGINFSEDYFIGDSDKVKYFTGLESLGLVTKILKRIKPFLFNASNSKLDGFQQLILTFMKLRLALTNRDLGYRFNISAKTAGNIFYNTLNALYKLMKHNIVWPEREILHATMPMCFRENFGKSVATIIDCFEIFIEKPSNILSKAETWSNYKHHNTIKYLISITPQGTVSFISTGWGGRVSDKMLTENCGLLKNLLPGDVVLADRGFDIADSVSMFYATIKLPTFTRGVKQLSPQDIESTRKIANVRIHVERVIGLLRQKYKILSSSLPIELLHAASESEKGKIATIDKIVTVTCGLINLTSPVIPME